MNAIKSQTQTEFVRTMCPELHTLDMTDNSTPHIDNFYGGKYSENPEEKKKLFERSENRLQTSLQASKLLYLHYKVLSKNDFAFLTNF